MGTSIEMDGDQMRNGHSFTTLDIDEMDIALAKELERNGRQNDSQLAAKLGVSSSTVGRKLKRLLDSKAIIFAGMPNPAYLKSKTVAYFGIQTKPCMADQVLEHIQQCCQSLQYSGLYMGRYDLLSAAVFDNYQKLLDFMDGDLVQVPDIVGVEVTLCMKFVKLDWRYLSGSSDMPQEPTARDLDEQELMIMKRLELNPRESIVDMSKNLGLNRFVIGRKLQNLLNENIIKVIGIINPKAFGLHALVAIRAEVFPGEIGAVAEKVAQHKNAHHVVITSGRFNLLIWAVFQDSDDLYGFLKNDLGAIPGVVRHETMSQIITSDRVFGLPI